MNLVIKLVLPTDCSPKNTNLNFFNAAWANSEELGPAVVAAGVEFEIVVGVVVVLVDSYLFEVKRVSKG